MLDSSSEHFQERKHGHTGDRQLLVGVDAPITTATQYALRQLATFFTPYAAHLHLLVLTVIPTPYPAGRYAARAPLSPTREQRTQAEETLRAARAALQHDGMGLAHIETLVRVGSPADELAAVARKRNIDCPVMVVTLPRSRRPGDLTAWYEAAMVQRLGEQPDTLVVFTAAEVAGRFLPHHVHTPGRKERAAAMRALEHLVRAGVLCPRDVQGEVRYLND